MMRSAAASVASITTGGAAPAALASAQRDAHRHQRSPARRPGKPRDGVTRSLPCATEVEKCLVDLRAHDVNPEVVRAGCASPVAIDAGHRRGGAGRERCTVDVGGAPAQRGLHGARRHDAGGRFREVIVGRAGHRRAHRWRAVGRAARREQAERCEERCVSDAREEMGGAFQQGE